MVVCLRWDVFARKMIYADEHQICVQQEICGGHHQIRTNHTKRFLEVRKLVHFNEFLPPRGFCIALQGISPLPNDFAIQRENSFSSSRCPPDIDEIRWQNSSGADSRLIDPPSPTTDLQRQVTYIDTVLHTYL